MKKILFLTCLFFNCFAQNRNPLVPGYFADPTIKKIGDTFYLYATTDGTGWGGGPAQVWTSKDFVNWTIQPMNWPNTHWYWAPDVTKGYDGKYYLYYSQPVEIFAGQSESPVGPWTPIDSGKAIIPNYMIPGVITLDAQTFTDDDGSIYMFWGTWGIYPEHGCAVGKLNPDMKTFSKVELIPNTVAKDFFEAPFMFKKDGIYYFMYSSGRCEDHTYRVQYLKSTTGPFGPYEYPDENPILVTNEDGTVHGPGHHSVLEHEGKYYIVYHRHNNPHSNGGFHRQLAADLLEFDEKGNIKKVKPTHSGIGLLGPNQIPYTNLALRKTVKASSEYNLHFQASNAADDDNGTLWRAKDNMKQAWWQVDLGEVITIQSILTQFEYATYYYQYRIEYSTDQKTWKTFADRSQNTTWGSPMADFNQVQARYIRITVLETQQPGLPRGIWNVKIFKEKIKGDFPTSSPQKEPVVRKHKDLLVHLSASDFLPGEKLKSLSNNGAMGGKFSASNQAAVELIEGKKGIKFQGTDLWTSNFSFPLQGNSSFTLIYDIFNPTIERFEPLITWSRSPQDLTKAIFGAGYDAQSGAVTHGGWADLSFKSSLKENKWQRIAITFDGYMQRVYVDGKEVSASDKMLFIRPDSLITLGRNGTEGFSGLLAELRIYDRALESHEIPSLETDKDWPYYFTARDLDYRKRQDWKNRGFIQMEIPSVEVEDFDGKMAVVGQDFIPSEAINYLKHNPDAELRAITKPKNGNAWGTLQMKGNGSVLWNGQNIHKFKPKEWAIHQWGIYKGTKAPLAVQSNILKIEGCKAFYTSGNQVLVQCTPQDGLEYYFDQWQSRSYHLYPEVPESIKVKVRDQEGNVSAYFTVPAPSPVKEIKGTIPEKRDFLGELPDFWDGTQWDQDVEAYIIGKNGQIELGSVNSSWDFVGKKGPFIYKEVEGNFTFTAKLTDIIGFAEKRNTATETGIMVQGSSTYLQNTILTGWNIGNMSTFGTQGTRIQRNNGLAWNYYPYLQIQKADEYFHLRISRDGTKWKDLIGSPFYCPELKNEKIKIGLFHASNNNVKGYGTYDYIQIISDRR
jgi:hypothetical protein